jgi:predicted MarR family transcription regulator
MTLATMTPEIASLRIARSIKSVENDMDELLAKAGELLAEMARARVATANAAALGQRPMARVAAMQRSLIDARSEIVRAHSDLFRLAETMDIPVDCPEKAMLGAGAANASRAA